MMNKRRLRIVLDVLLCAGILTLYNKRTFGMLYHEIAGVAAVVITMMHIGINLKTVSGMRRSFKRVPLNVKLCLITDILLIVAMAVEAVSGIMISKKLFAGIANRSMLFKQMHFFAGGATVLLLGLHIGLHICRRQLPRVLAVVLSVAALGFGIAGVAQTSLVRWMSMPFTAGSEGEHGGMERPEGAPGQSMDTGTETSAEGTARTEAEAGGEGTPEQLAENVTAPTEGNRPGHEGGGPDGKGQAELSVVQRLLSIAEFWGMMFTVAMGTYWIVRGKKEKRDALAGKTND